MTEQEARNKMEKGFAEVKPIVEQSTRLLMDAYDKGFNLGMDIGLQCRVEMALGHSEVTKKSDQEIIREVEHLFIENDWCCVEDVNADLVARHFVKWQNDRVRVRAYAWLKNQPLIGVADSFIKELCDYITQQTMQQEPCKYCLHGIEEDPSEGLVCRIDGARHFGNLNCDKIVPKSDVHERAKRIREHNNYLNSLPDEDLVAYMTMTLSSN